MATLGQILQSKWPGAQWSLSGDDYATLDWLPENVLPKPSEAEIRAFSAEVDAEIAAAAADQEREDALLGIDPGAIFKAVDILADALADIRGKILPAALSSALNTTATNRLNALRQKIAEIKA